MSVQRVSLTVAVVLGYFVRFETVGASFETVEKVYNQLFGEIRVFPLSYLILILLTTTIVAPPSNASKWQMGFNSAFKGLITGYASYVFCVT
jgi:hypothetical protein